MQLVDVMWTVYERHTRGCAFPVSERCLSAARPEGERPFGSDLFRSAVVLLFPVASIYTTGGAEMPSNTTNSTKKPATGERQSRGDSVNQVTLIGRLVATPELWQTGSGNSVTTIRVATNGKSHAEFHDIVLWGQLASFACSYLGKGRLVYIEGRLQSRQW